VSTTLALVSYRPDAFVGRGAVRLRRHDPVMAVADYNEALRLDPKNVAALQGRGYAYFLRKDGRACPACL
jgi:cytochrome c-type biogenesis protein CcmH/NrfG